LLLIKCVTMKLVILILPIIKCIEILIKHANSTIVRRILTRSGVIVPGVTEAVITKYRSDLLNLLTSLYKNSK
jgi:hypothetical protein